MNKQNEITLKLKECIDSGGPDFLSDKPYEVFNVLVSSKIADKKTAGVIFCVLVNNLHKSALKMSDSEKFSALIKKECGFNKALSDFAASVFLALYSNENKEEWNGKVNEGLKQFIEEEMEVEWNGFCVWKISNGSVDCHYNAIITLKATSEIIKDKKLKNKLDKNPFLKKEEIISIFQKSLCEKLDMEFKEYCTCDDYYEPNSEDFEGESYTADWCVKNGFELISFEGEGYDGAFEPEPRHYYY